MGNAISLTSLLSSGLAAQTAGTDAGMAILKKSNDFAKQEAAALVQMLEDSLPQNNQRLLDVYA
jgi:hypothetical protein